MLWMPEEIFLFDLLGIWYEMNPNKIFCDGWRMTDGPVENDGDMLQRWPRGNKNEGVNLVGITILLDKTLRNIQKYFYEQVHTWLDNTEIFKEFSTTGSNMTWQHLNIQKNCSINRFKHDLTALGNIKKSLNEGFKHDLMTTWISRKV